MVFKFRPLVVAVLSLGITHASHALEISPSVATVGKETLITLKAEAGKQIEKVSLQPGGPVVLQTLPQKPGEHGDYKVTNLNKALVIQQRMGSHWFDAAQLQNGQEHSNNVEVHVGSLTVTAKGLQGITVTKAEGDKSEWVGSHQKLGRVTQVTAADNHVLALNDTNIIFLIELTNPSEPTVINAYRSDKAITEVAWFDQTVFAKTKDTIEVIDFSTPMPFISNEGLDFGQGVNFGGERRVFIENNMAYVADWFSGIHIYDISNPHLPLLLSSYHTPGSPKGVVVRDNIAYIPDDDHGLQIIDVSNPRDPKQLGHIQTSGLGYTPRLVGDLLYLASHRGGFHVIDISNPAKPTLVSEVNTPGKAWSMEVKDDIAYIADDDTGLLIYSVKNPASPKLIGQFTPGTAAEEVLIHGEFAFVAFFDDGLYVLDIKDPTQPKVISHTQIPGNSRGLDLVDNTLYVASWLAGIHTVDISNLKAPRILGSYDTRGATWGLEVKDDYLYAMDWWGGIAVIDVKDPANPYAVAGYHERGRINQIATRDNYAFVANGSNGLQVFDIKNPLHPTWMTGLNFAGIARDIALHGDYAFLAMGDAGLAIANIANPYQARWVSSTETSGIVDKIEIRGQHAFLIDVINGVLIYDISNLKSPQLLESIPGQANALHLEGKHLTIANNDGINRYVISNDGQAELIQTLELDGGANHLASYGGIIFSSQNNTLLVIDDNSLSLKNSLKMDSAITDLETTASEEGVELIVSGSHSIHQITLNSNTDLSRGAINHYPLLGRVSSVETHRGTVYMGGEKTITAVKLLSAPVLNTDNTFTLSPETYEGSYHITTTYNEGIQSTIKNAIHVRMPKFSKPKMTMEEFEKLLQEKQGSDIFVSP